MKAKNNPNIGIKSDPIALEVRRIGALIERKDLANAEASALKLIQTFPKRPDVHSILGIIYIQQKKERLAVPHLEFAVRVDPENAYYLNNLGRLYLDMQIIELALPFLSKALTINPKLTSSLLAIGTYYTEVGKAELAVPYFERLHRIVPQDNAVKWHLAGSLDSLGRNEQAAKLYDELHQTDTHFIAALRYFSRNPSPGRNTSFITEIEQRLLSNSYTDKECSMLHTALGFLYEREERYSLAFPHFEKANQLRALPFDIEKYRAWVDKVIDLITPGLLRERRDIGNQSPTPVLIVGMPRSGTTLTEQMIASHAQAAGAGELSRIGRLAISLNFSPLRNIDKFIPSLNAEGNDRLRGAAGNYVNLLKFHAPEAARVVDKMPHNFQYLGLAALLWPNARIIHCTRVPLDTCLSCFQNALGDQHAYSRELATLGLYYREYRRLMDHWKAVLPTKIYELSYERFTADFENEARKVIEFIGLPWDESCLRFHEAERTVRTLSMQQVRNPVYRSSVGRWQHYERELQPLRSALGDLVSDASCRGYGAACSDG